MTDIDVDAQKEALWNLICMARPYMTDEPQRLALKLAEEAYRAQSAPALDDVRETVARAIEDAEVDYMINLVSLVDGTATYALDYADGDETLMFASHAHATDHVASRRALMRADGAIAAMRGRA